MTLVDRIRTWWQIETAVAELTRDREREERVHGELHRLVGGPGVGGAGALPLLFRRTPRPAPVEATIRDEDALR